MREVAVPPKRRAKRRQMRKTRQTRNETQQVPPEEEELGPEPDDVVVTEGLVGPGHGDTRVFSLNIRGGGNDVKMEVVRRMVREALADVVTLQEMKGGKKRFWLRKCLGRGWHVQTSHALGEAGTADGRNGGVLLAVKKATIGKGKYVMDELVPGYLMRLKWEEGKEKLTVLNMYYPTGDTQERDFLRHQVETELEHAIEEAADSRLVLACDGNEWAKEGGGLERSGLHDMRSECGDNKPTWRRDTEKGRQEANIDKVLCNDKARERVGSVQTIWNEMIAWERWTDHSLVVLDLVGMELGKREHVQHCRTRRVLNIPRKGSEEFMRLAEGWNNEDKTDLGQAGYDEEDECKDEELHDKKEVTMMCEYRKAVRGKLAECESFETLGKTMVDMAGQTFKWREITTTDKEYLPKKAKKAWAILMKKESSEEEQEQARATYKEWCEQRANKRRENLEKAMKGKRRRLYRGVIQTENAKAPIELLSLKDEEGKVVGTETDPDKVKEGWRSFMEKLATKTVVGENPVENGGYPLEYVEKVTGLMEPVTEEQVDRAARRQYSGKAPGPDGVIGELLRFAGFPLVQWLTRKYNDILQGGDIEACLKESNVVMLMKGEGLVGDPSCRRPISLIPLFVRILQTILAARFQEAALKAKVFGPEQYGFLRGRKIQTPIANVLRVIRDAQQTNRPFYVLGLDISKAYDSVDFGALKKGMIELGVERKFIEYIERLYQGRKARVLTAYGPTEEYEIQRGIAQGDPTSCVLFLCFMEYIMKRLRVKAVEMEAGYTLAGRGGTRRLVQMAFADDLLLIGRSRKEIQTLGEMAVRLIEEAGMKVNYKKTDLLTNEKGARPPLEIGGNLIEMQARGGAIRYLGIWIDEQGTLKVNTEQLIKRMTEKLERIGASGMPPEVVIQMVNEMVTPMLMYVAQSAPVRREGLDKLKSTYKRVVGKVVGGIGRADPDDILFMEKGLGGMGLKNPVEVHDITAVLQVLERLADGESNDDDEQTDLHRGVQEDLEELQVNWGREANLMEFHENLPNRGTQRGLVEEVIRIMKEDGTHVRIRGSCCERPSPYTNDRLITQLLGKRKDGSRIRKTMTKKRITWLSDLVKFGPRGQRLGKCPWIRGDQRNPQWWMDLRNIVCVEDGMLSPNYRLQREEWKDMYPRRDEDVGHEEEGFIVYTDGSARRAKTDEGPCSFIMATRAWWRAGWGFARMAITGRIVEEDKFCGRCSGYKQSNNEAEIQAVWEALKWAKGKKIEIRTDSKYVISWVNKFRNKKRDWTSECLTHGGMALLYAVWQEVKNYPGQIAIRWVKGHQQGGSDDAVGNGAADALADRGTAMELREEDVTRVDEACSMVIADGKGKVIADGSNKRGMKELRRKRGLEGALKKRRNGALIVSALSGNAERNKERITKGMRTRNYVRMMTQQYKPGDQWAHLDEKFDEAGKILHIPCPLCGGFDSYKHIIDECPAMMKVRRAMWTDQVARNRIGVEHLGKTLTERSGVRERKQRNAALERMELHVTNGRIDVGQGGVNANIIAESFWELFDHARDNWPAQKTYDEFLQTFPAKVSQLIQRYGQNGVDLGEGRRTTVENAWVTPWNLSTAMKQAFTLTAMMFSHPGNVDPSYSEHYTPSKEDAFFGARFDGFSLLNQDRDLLCFANPEYSVTDMENFFANVAKAVQREKAFRCITVVPFARGKENRDGPKGVDCVRRAGGLVEVLADIPEGLFSFWKPNFWIDGAKGRGCAPWPLAFVLMENQKAREKYPVDEEAWASIRHQLKDQFKGMRRDDEVCLWNDTAAPLPLALNVMEIDTKLKQEAIRRLIWRFENSELIENCVKFEMMRPIMFRYSAECGLVDAELERELGHFLDDCGWTDCLIDYLRLRPERVYLPKVKKTAEEEAPVVLEFAQVVEWRPGITDYGDSFEIQIEE
jgi:ribonuclease HI